MEKTAQKRHLQFMTAYSRMKTSYGLDMNEDDFIEIAYSVWRDIGNIAPKTTRMYATVPEDGILELPDDCEFVMAVTQIDDPKVITTWDSGGRKDREVPAVYTVSYTPTRNEQIAASYGESVNWENLGDNAIQITSPDLYDHDVQIVYNSMQLDEIGLPLLNDKEVAAIAAEVARQMITAQLMNSMKGKISGAQAQVSQMLFQQVTQDAMRLMAAAKIDEKITDDAIDKMLDMQTSWDRKLYGKRWNPLK